MHGPHAMNRLRRRLCCKPVPAIEWTIAAALLLGSAPGHADETPHEAIRAEYRLKAGFLYNFAKYVEWPASAFHSAQEPLRLCIFGNEAYTAVRDVLAGKTVKGRALDIVQPGNAAEAARCQVVFVSAEYRAGAQAQSMPPGLAASALKVGETPDFLHNGGTINLVRSDNRIRFEMRRNSTAATPPDLQFSSQLLKLAVLTDDTRQGGER